MENSDITSIQDIVKTSLNFKKGEKHLYVYKCLKEAIIKNILKPQQRVVENDLMELFRGFSRTPIRDALKRLTYEGYIENIPQRGMFVSQVSFKDLLEISEIRLRIESLALELFLQRTDEEEIEKIGESVSKQESSLKSGDSDAALNYDNQFHIILARGSKNTKLAALIESYIFESRRGGVFLLSRDINRMKRSVNDHKLIFEAISSHNIKKAVEYMDLHIEGWIDYIKDVQINKYFQINS